MDQWSLLVGALGGAGAIAALRSLLLTAMTLWAKYRGDADELGERHSIRKDGITQDDKARLWQRIDQLEDSARKDGERHDRELAALAGRHDRELTDLRDKLGKVQAELDVARAAVAIKEGLYTALLQAHEKLRLAHDELKVQVAAVQAENAELRRRLPPGKEPS